MATLGAIILLTTFVVCIYAAAASIAGARRGSGPLIDSGIGGLYLTTALMTVASGIIVHAFVVGLYRAPVFVELPPHTIISVPVQTELALSRLDSGVGGTASQLFVAGL